MPYSSPDTSTYITGSETRSHCWCIYHPDILRALIRAQVSSLCRSSASAEGYRGDISYGETHLFCALHCCVIFAGCAFYVQSVSTVLCINCFYEVGDSTITFE